MNSFAAALESLGGELVQLVEDAFASGSASGWSDAQVLEVMATAARLTRAAEALVIEATAQAAWRSKSFDKAERMTTRFGCRSVNELVQRTTRVSRHTAADMIKAAAAIGQSVTPFGEVLPPAFPGMRDALARAEVGVDGVVAVSAPMTACSAGRAAVLAADEELASSACGRGADGAPPACADDLRAQATVWAMYLDPDGAEPREAQALRKRGITLGVCRNGVVPFHGNLLAEVAGQLQRGFDSVLNPKVEGVLTPGPFFAEDDALDEGGGFDPDAPRPAQADLRSRAQKQHDALATILTTIAGSGALPTLGGAAPTLVVSVQAADLERGEGHAHISGCDEPVSLASARHIACSGAVQRVIFGENGRIVSIGTLERVFNHHQRRAIALRDGGCVIPGCHVSADWCEVHHVDEHARGGPTHTSNGVLLCWFHHRTIDSSGWKIRMNNGVPEVRGPYWWDAQLIWRPVTKSPVLMRERITRRT